MSPTEPRGIIYYDYINNDPRLRRNCEFAGTEEEFRKFNSERQKLLDQIVHDYPLRFLKPFYFNGVTVEQIERNPNNTKKCILNISRINNVDPKNKVNFNITLIHDDDTETHQDLQLEYSQLEFICMSMYSLSLAREQWINQNSDNSGNYNPEIIPFLKDYKNYIYTIENPFGTDYVFYTEDNTPQGEGGQIYLIGQINRGQNQYGKEFTEDRIAYYFK